MGSSKSLFIIIILINVKDDEVYLSVDNISSKHFHINKLLK